MGEGRAPVVTTNIDDHPAVRAWLKFGGRTLPRGVEVLEDKNRSAVYRLVDAGPRHTPIIAKRNKPEFGAVERTIYEVVLPQLPIPCLQLHGSALDSDSRC